VRGYFGISGVVTGVLHQSGGAEYVSTGGGGAAIWGGVRIGPIFAFEANYTGSFHNHADYVCGNSLYYEICGADYLVLDMLSFDAKFHIPTHSVFDPFFQAGLMLAWLGHQGFASDATGGGFDLGGGFDVWLSPIVTFGVRALYRGVKLGDYATYTGTDEFLHLMTGEVNLGFHF
jgi:hypothetical protein